MQLLLTLNSGSDFHSLLYCNTETEKVKYLLIENHLGLHTGYETTGMVHSGVYLVFYAFALDGISRDRLVIMDVFSNMYDVFECEHVIGATSIISIYPGKLYLDSPGSNSIVCVDFDPVNLSYFNDSVYYTLDGNKDYKLRSLCEHRNTWFVASGEQKQIIDLTNDRIVFSHIYDPRCIFFNSNQRLCFLETKKGLFHCGDDVFFVGSSPTAAIEDRDNGGYWIACGQRLKFFDYEGKSDKTIDLAKWGLWFNTIVEAEGWMKS